MEKYPAVPDKNCPLQSCSHPWKKRKCSQVSTSNKNTYVTKINFNDVVALVEAIRTSYVIVENCFNVTCVATLPRTSRITALLSSSIKVVIASGNSRCSTDQINSIARNTSTLQSAAVLSSCHCRANFVWVRHGSSTTFETGLILSNDTRSFYNYCFLLKARLVNNMYLLV